MSILIYACSTTKPNAKDQENQKRIAEASEDRNIDFENTNKMNAIQEGEAIFENQCTLCHEPKNIQDYNYEQWVEIVEDMSQRVNKKLRREEIRAMDEANLLTYIKTRL